MSDNTTKQIDLGDSVPQTIIEEKMVSPTTEITKTIDLGGSIISLNTGKLATNADGAVVVSMGDTKILCTVVFEKKAKDNNIDFLPLGVFYREMSYAGGKIPGGFIKKEGKFSDHEVITSRLIDRSIRPLFHTDFYNEVQVICTVISYDPQHNPDILSIIGASAALAISGIPITKPIAAARVGMIGNELILNPSAQQLENHKELDLVISGNQDAITMVESQSYEFSDKKILEAMQFGRKYLSSISNLISELQSEVNKKNFPVLASPYVAYIEKFSDEFYNDAKAAFLTSHNKKQREEALQQVKEKIINKFLPNSQEKENLNGDNEVVLQYLERAIKRFFSIVLRNLILNENKRMSGRVMNQVRGINCQTGYLNRAHGSALFCRGETQSLASVTLGTGSDEQIIENLGKEVRQHFLLDYLFLPYSVGEIGHLRGASRREIGHARLAQRALYPVIPGKDQFPYTIRVVSEITGCDGSSSMATICGASLSMMDAGIPIKSHVAGIAMGLIKEGNNYKILSDIMAYEDFLGDMDFKVAGTNQGITALQLDVKIEGIDFGIIEEIFTQAKQGIDHILEIMTSTIDCPRSELSKYAPSIKIIEVRKDKIRDIIGAGGKVIKEICSSYNVEIDLSEDGTVKIYGVGQENVDKALKQIQSIASPNPRIGEIFLGTVVKIVDHGIFINYGSTRDGFIYKNEIVSNGMEGEISDYLKVGDKIKVKPAGLDYKNRMKLNIADRDFKSANIGKKNEKVESKKIKIQSASTDEIVISERKYFD